ncbi:MAG TPA: DUF3175 domain-containing protein [Puia sp.]|nr:DUF3175 domain-containing protein [Puia sp.]
MSTIKKSPAKKKTGKTAAAKGRWSADVTKHSNALDLKKGVFTLDSPKKIAQSLEKSAEDSDRKKGSAHQSAMSMLNFYINRAGKNLPATRKKTLVKAKEELKAMNAKGADGRKSGGSHRSGSRKQDGK